MRRPLRPLVFALALAMGATWTPAMATGLGPESSGLVDKIGRAIAGTGGCDLTSQEIDERVTYTLACQEPVGAARVSLLPPTLDGPPGALKTRHGWLVLPTSWRAMESLTTTVDGVAGELRWSVAREDPAPLTVYEVDADVAERSRAALVEALRLRDESEAPTNASSDPDDQLSQVFPELLGRGGQVIPGRILEQIRQRPTEPTLWAALAGAHWREGDAGAALAAADVATRIGPGDPDARRVWRQLQGAGGEEWGARQAEESCRPVHLPLLNTPGGLILLHFPF